MVGYDAANYITAITGLGCARHTLYHQIMPYFILYGWSVVCGVLDL